MRRKPTASYIVAVAMLLFAVLLAGCAGSADGRPVLHIVNWEDYGSDAPAFVAAFEEEYGCKIVNQYMQSEEDLLTKLRTSKPGEIDLCLPNCTILTAAIEDGLLAEIDTGRLKNFDSLFDRFKTQKEVMLNGKYYAVPWVWGATAVAYNTDLVTMPPSSMSVLFDEAYAGKISFRDDYNDAIMAAAIVTGQDPNSPSDMEAIKEALIAQKKLNRNYWETGDEFTKLFTGGQLSVAMMWSGQAASMKLEGEPIAFVVPDDGAIGWVDNWGIVAGTKNEDLSYAFIDWMISKDFQYDWASSGGPAPVNREAADAVDPEYAAAAAMDEASLNKLYFMEYRSDEVKREWNELWTEVKAAN